MLSQERLIELTQLYYHSIYRYCLSQIKNPHDAKDITQDVFFLLVERAPELEDINIRSWLYEVATRKLKENYRSKMVASKLSSLDENYDIVSTEEDFVHRIEREDVDEKIIQNKKEEILKSLSVEELKLYKDVHIEKKTYPTIAEAMGLKEKTVNMRSQRLKKKIKDKVKKSFNSLKIFLMIL